MYFISYARKQLYYAEHLALYFQQQDIGIWFDVQDLTPGVAWRSGIEHGLATCDGLILLASRDALRSPYVAKEWTTVFSDGRPVYVLFTEEVDLPDSLSERAAAIIDARADFDAALDRLRASLVSGTPQRDPYRAPTAWAGRR